MYAPDLALPFVYLERYCCDDASSSWRSSIEVAKGDDFAPSTEHDKTYVARYPSQYAVQLFYGATKLEDESMS